MKVGVWGNVMMVEWRFLVVYLKGSYLMNDVDVLKVLMNYFNFFSKI